MDKEIFKYVRDHLLKELSEISISRRSEYEKCLTIYEKAIIYNYTDYGYESLNEQLRNGQAINDFGRFLNYSLDKLPNYNGLCYRTIKCSKNEIKKYFDAFKNDMPILEETFLSCSKSRILALYFSESPLFIIKSKKGKDIEKIAKFGIDSGQNEKEILFKSKSKFKVLDIAENDHKVIIYLEEI